MQFSFGFAQKTWNEKAISQKMSMEQYKESIVRLNSVRQLRSIAEVCNNDGRFEKAAIAYEHLVKKFNKKVHKEDVKSFYNCLLMCGRVGDIPFDSLKRFTSDVSDLLKLARIRNERSEEENERMKKINLESKLVYGYNFYQTDKVSVYSDSLNQLLAYSIDNNQFKDEVVIEHAFNKKKYQVVSVENFGSDTHMYTILNKRIGLYRIKIIGNELPKFTHNSRYYSTGMPWFDTKTNRLYFCSDDKKGYGGWDIYYSKLKNEHWLKPVLLDDKVNTHFDDMFPVIHNNWLLYASAGHKGKGNLDNFAFDMLQETNYNLFECNTALDDFCIRVGNDSTEFFTCQQTQILHGHYDDFWERAVKVEDVEHYLLRENSLVKSRMGAFVEPKSQLIVPNHVSEKENHIYEFNSGESIYFPFDKDTFDRSSFPYLNQCVNYFSNITDARTVLVYGSTDSRGTDAYNYLLSLKRARRVIAYMKLKAKKDFNYKTIVLGEKLYSNNKQISDKNSREVFVQASNFDLPYDIMIAIGKDEVENLNELANLYNNKLTDLEKLNSLIVKDKLSSLYLVGIHDIHQVFRNETLSELSVRYACSVDDLIKINNKKDTNLLVGELLIIPLQD